jgi:hypothetical protein
VAGRAAHRADSEVDVKVALATTTWLDRPVEHRGKDLDPRSASSARTGPVPYVGVTEQPPRPARSGLGVDEVLGLRAILL